MKLKLIVTSMVILLFSACTDSNKNEASVENFTNVINEHFKQRDFCIKITDKIGKFPDETSGATTTLYEYQVYEKMGFLKLTPQRVKYQGMIGGGDKDGMTDGYKVELTEKGKKAYHDDKKGSFSSKGFCIGYYKVDKISNYTTPAERNGFVMSKVDYTLTAMNLEDKIVKIIKEEQAKGQFYSTKIDKSKEESRALILTEMKGWIHERDMRRR
ncbi:hypothetical protein MNB_SV-12-603 [hydrothermal vent metagenome]|uniref:Lipoprotein n=1 Tax=hydrothermal vent metagenome TaxID=652676 RepID=A0A1W1BQY0_9ZZZZ